MNTTAKQGGKKLCLQLQSLMLPSSGVTEQESWPAKISITFVGCVYASSFLSYYLVGKLFSALLFPCKPRAFFFLKNKPTLMSWDEPYTSSDRTIMRGKKRSLFALIQVQFFSFTYNKKENVIILSSENSWNCLKLYY